MAGFTRTNGNAQPGSWYGLTPRYLKIDTGNVIYSLDPSNAQYYGNTLSNFEKAVFAISSQASIVTLGKPTEGGNCFIVRVDNTFGVSTTDASNVSITGSLASSIKSALTANAVVITESTGYSGSGFAAFA
jgi:hypothetical protein